MYTYWSFQFQMNNKERHVQEFGKHFKKFKYDNMHVISSYEARSKNGCEK